MRPDLLLKALDAASGVKRWHTVRTVYSQNLAEHSYEVALIVARCGGSSAAVIAALEHDLGESETGDVPAPFKRKYQNAALALEQAELDAQRRLGCTVYGLDAADAWLVKFADVVSGLRFATREVQMGNRAMRLPAARFREYLGALWRTDVAPDPRARAEGVYYAVCAEYDTLKESHDGSQ